MARRLAERLAERTRFRKFFDTDVADLKQAVIGSGPIHYEMPGGGWDDLANLVREVPGGWAAETSETRVGVENGWLTFSKAGRSLKMRPVALGMVDATAPETRWRKLANADYSNVTRDGNRVTAHDIFPNTDATLTISEGVVTKAFTVRQKPNPPDPVGLGWNPATTYVVIAWDVQKPDGAVVRDTVTHEVVSSGYARKNPLVVETSAGEPVVYFDAGEAVSASGRTGPVWYVSLGAQVPFAEAVPYSRIVTTSYPFVIDPTASVNITEAGNAQTVERYSSDSTGVTYTYRSSLSVGGYSFSGGKDPYSRACKAYLRFDLTGISEITAATIYYYRDGELNNGCQLAAYKQADWLGVDAATLYTRANGTQVFNYVMTSVPGWYSAAALNLPQIQASEGGILPLYFYGATGNWWLADFHSYGTAEAPYLSVEYTTPAFVWDGSGITADAVIRKIQTGSLTENAALKRIQTGSFAASAVIRKTQTGSLAADAVTERQQTGSLAADAFLRATGSASLSLDAVIRKTQTGSLAADAWVASTVAVSGDLTADAVFQASQSAYALADALISRPPTSAFAADAVIRSTSTLQIGSDAIALRTSSATFTSDAEFLLVVASTFSADAVKQKTQTGLLTANAVIRQTRTAGFPADALLLSVQTTSITADALALRTVAGDLAAGAVVFWTQVRTATADASITKVVSGNIAATFAAATMSATPDAGTISATSARAGITGPASAATITTSSMAQTITATVFSQRAGGFTGDAVIV